MNFWKLLYIKNFIFIREFILLLFIPNQGRALIISSILTTLIGLIGRFTPRTFYLPREIYLISMGMILAAFSLAATFIVSVGILVCNCLEEVNNFYTISNINEISPLTSTLSDGIRGPLLVRVIFERTFTIHKAPNFQQP